MSDSPTTTGDSVVSKTPSEWILQDLLVTQEDSNDIQKTLQQLQLDAWHLNSLDKQVLRLEQACRAHEQVVKIYKSKQQQDTMLFLISNQDSSLSLLHDSKSFKERLASIDLHDMMQYARSSVQASSMPALQQFVVDSTVLQPQKQLQLQLELIRLQSFLQQRLGQQQGSTPTAALAQQHRSLWLAVDNEDTKQLERWIQQLVHVSKDESWERTSITHEQQTSSGTTSGQPNEHHQQQQHSRLVVQQRLQQCQQALQRQQESLEKAIRQQRQLRDELISHKEVLEEQLSGRLQKQVRITI